MIADLHIEGAEADTIMKSLEKMYNVMPKSIKEQQQINELASNNNVIPQSIEKTQPIKNQFTVDGIEDKKLFCLEKKILKYYNIHTNEEEGSIPLRSILDVSSLTESKFSIKLMEKNYILQASEASDAKKWIQLLRTLTVEYYIIVLPMKAQTFTGNMGISTCYGYILESDISNVWQNAFYRPSYFDSVQYASNIEGLELKECSSHADRTSDDEKKEKELIANFISENLKIEKMESDFEPIRHSNFTNYFNKNNKISLDDVKKEIKNGQ